MAGTIHTVLSSSVIATTREADSPESRVSYLETSQRRLVTALTLTIGERLQFLESDTESTDPVLRP